VNYLCATVAGPPLWFNGHSSWPTNAEVLGSIPGTTGPLNLVRITEELLE
jgi:hypothetical protein